MLKGKDKGCVRRVAGSEKRECQPKGAEGRPSSTPNNNTVYSSKMCRKYRHKYRYKYRYKYRRKYRYKYRYGFLLNIGRGPAHFIQFQKRVTCVHL